VIGKTTFIFCLCLILISIVSTGCGASKQRNFADADLLIDESAMPNDWSLAERSYNMTVKEGQESGAYITFYYTGTSLFVRGGEDVYRYKNNKRAAWHYKRFETDHFNDASVYRTTPWQVPEGFHFSSSSSEQWRFACAGSNFTVGSITGNTSTVCIYLAQYDEFLVFFSITIERDGAIFISIEQIISILDALDQNMGQYLNP